MAAHLSRCFRRSPSKQSTLPLLWSCADLASANLLQTIDQSSRAASGSFASSSATHASLPHRHYTSASRQETPPHESTVNKKEAQKFAKLAGEWWDPHGSFRPLHKLNPTRCNFIKTSICDNYGLDPSAPAPLRGLRLLDVGCGGGILSEALARMGAEVEGIDVNEEGIAAASAHAALDHSLIGKIEYSTTTVESIAASGRQYDAVIASEVIEHVASVPAFCTALVKATKPGGAVVISTLNRTVRAYVLAVVAAEQFLKWAPPGTHEWDKFLTPEELILAMEDAGNTQKAEVVLEQAAGMIFDPLRGEWGLGRDLGINYIAYFKKARIES